MVETMIFQPKWLNIMFIKYKLSFRNEKNSINCRYSIFQRN
jgi:hypothetical protein